MFSRPATLEGMNHLRNLDELEGTLLPIAVPVHGSHESDNGVGADTAVPVAQFRYDDLQPLEVDQDIFLLNNVDEIQDAPLIPQCDDPRSRAQQVAQAIARANRLGQAKAELESEAMARATRQMKTKAHYNKLLVEEANNIAQRRNAEGLQVHLQNELLPTKNDENASTETSRPVGPGGYNVSEYQVGDYKGEDNYQFSEYKSVYDP